MGNLNLHPRQSGFLHPPHRRLVLPFHHNLLSISADDTKRARSSEFGLPKRGKPVSCSYAPRHARLEPLFREGEHDLANLRLGCTDSQSCGIPSLVPTLPCHQRDNKHFMWCLSSRRTLLESRKMAVGFGSFLQATKIAELCSLFGLQHRFLVQKSATECSQSSATQQVPKP